MRKVRFHPPVFFCAQANAAIQRQSNDAKHHPNHDSGNKLCHFLTFFLSDLCQTAHGYSGTYAFRPPLRCIVSAVCMFSWYFCLPSQTRSCPGSSATYFRRRHAGMHTQRPYPSGKQGMKHQCLFFKVQRMELICPSTYPKCLKAECKYFLKKRATQKLPGHFRPGIGVTEISFRSGFIGSFSFWRGKDLHPAGEGQSRQALPIEAVCCHRQFSGYPVQMAYP